MRPPRKPKSQWIQYITWALIIGWMYLGLAQGCEPMGPGNDCVVVGGAQWGEDC